MASRSSTGRALGPGIRWAIVAGDLKRVPVGREEGKLVLLTAAILSFKNKKGSRALEEKILTNTSNVYTFWMKKMYKIEVVIMCTLGWYTTLS